MARRVVVVLATLSLLACSAVVPGHDAGNDAGSDAGGGGTGGASDSGIPPGPDTTTPYPLDRGDDASAPGTYKGLPLRLVDNGAPTVTAVDGLIGVVCIGMSNATQECTDFMTKLSAGTFTTNSKVRFVDCAVGSNAIERWNEPANDAKLWDGCVNKKLGDKGVRVDQVRVIYHKAADMDTTGPGGAALPLYPNAGSDYAAFLTNLSTFAGRVKTKFPAVQAVYTTSRSYGGFAGTVARGEPLSYEEGHALNTWLAKNPSVQGVWYGWGPYIWAPDCATGITNASSVCYLRDDYKVDGVHPATGGLDKVSTMLHQRFSKEAWYRP